MRGDGGVVGVDVGVIVGGSVEVGRVAEGALALLLVLLDVVVVAELEPEKMKLCGNE